MSLFDYPWEYRDEDINVKFLLKMLVLFIGVGVVFTFGILTWLLLSLFY